jgi:hypothetical protein
VTLKVTCHPWTTGQIKIESAPRVKQVTLPAHTCVELRFGPYPSGKKPNQKYTDVFIKTRQGDWYKEGWDTDMLAAMILPPRENGRTALAFAKPLPSPWMFDLAGYGPSTFSIRRVRGLPAGWRVSFLRPALGAKFRLEPKTKHFPLMCEVLTKRLVARTLKFDLEFEVVLNNRRGSHAFWLRYRVAADDRLEGQPLKPEDRRHRRPFVKGAGNDVPFASLRQSKILVG